MSELIDRRTQIGAGVAVVVGVLALLGIEYREEPSMRGIDFLFALVDIVPIVLVSVGVVLLIKVSAQQREQTLSVVRDLEVARLQGQRWRTEARTLLKGLGDAIDEQFKLWNLTEAEREVALLLLKGLSLKEIAQVRSTSERTDPRAGTGTLCEGRPDRQGCALGVLPRGFDGADRPDRRALAHGRSRAEAILLSAVDTRPARMGRRSSDRIVEALSAKTGSHGRSRRARSTVVRR